MARIPDSEIERLKSEVSVQRLVEASGIELKKSGKDIIGQCPFHEDSTASLVVTPQHDALMTAPSRRLQANPQAPRRRWRSGRSTCMAPLVAC